MRLHSSIPLLVSLSFGACIDQPEDLPTSAVADEVQVLTSCRATGQPYQYQYNAILSAPTAGEGQTTSDAYSRSPEKTACPSETTIVKAVLGSAPHLTSFTNSIDVSTDWRWGSGGGAVPAADQMTKAMCENSTLSVSITETFASGLSQLVASSAVHGTWTLYVYPNTDQPDHYGCAPNHITYDAGATGGTFLVAAQVVRGLAQNDHGYGNVSFDIENSEH